MAIHWSLDRLEKLLPPALCAKLAVTSCNPSIPMEAGGIHPVNHGETGAMLPGVTYAKGLRVPRSKIRALCAEGIDVQDVTAILLGRYPQNSGAKENQERHRLG